MFILIIILVTPEAVNKCKTLIKDPTCVTLLLGKLYCVVIESTRLTDDDVVVDAHPGDEDDETEELERVEALPTDGDRDHPDDERPHAVQHHPGGRGHLLRHRDSGKVEERDGDGGAAESHEQQRVVGQL